MEDLPDLFDPVLNQLHLQRIQAEMREYLGKMNEREQQRDKEWDLNQNNTEPQAVLSTPAGVDTDEVELIIPYFFFAEDEDFDLLIPSFFYEEEVFDLIIPSFFFEEATPVLLDEFSSFNKVRTGDFNDYSEKIFHKFHCMNGFHLHRGLTHSLFDRGKCELFSYYYEKLLNGAVPKLGYASDLGFIHSIGFLCNYNVEILDERNLFDKMSKRDRMFNLLFTSMIEIPKVRDQYSKMLCLHSKYVSHHHLLSMESGFPYFNIVGRIFDPGIELNITHEYSYFTLDYIVCVVNSSSIILHIYSTLIAGSNGTVVDNEVKVKQQPGEVEDIPLTFQFVHHRRTHLERFAPNFRNTEMSTFNFSTDLDGSNYWDAGSGKVVSSGFTFDPGRKLKLTKGYLYITHEHTLCFNVFTSCSFIFHGGAIWGRYTESLFYQLVFELGYPFEFNLMYQTVFLVVHNGDSDKVTKFSVQAPQRISTSRRNSIPLCTTAVDTKKSCEWFDQMLVMWGEFFFLLQLQYKLSDENLVFHFGSLDVCFTPLHKESSIATTVLPTLKSAVLNSNNNFVTLHVYALRILLAIIRSCFQLLWMGFFFSSLGPMSVFYGIFVVQEDEMKFTLLMIQVPTMLVLLYSLGWDYKWCRKGHWSINQARWTRLISFAVNYRLVQLLANQKNNMQELNGLSVPPAISIMTLSVHKEGAGTDINEVEVLHMLLSVTVWDQVHTELFSFPRALQLVFSWKWKVTTTSDDVQFDCVLVRLPCPVELKVTDPNFYATSWWYYGSHRSSFSIGLIPCYIQANTTTSRDASPSDSQADILTHLILTVFPNGLEQLEFTDGPDSVVRMDLPWILNIARSVLILHQLAPSWRVVLRHQL